MNKGQTFCMVLLACMCLMHLKNSKVQAKDVVIEVEGEQINLNDLMKDDPKTQRFLKGKHGQYFGTLVEKVAKEREENPDKSVEEILAGM